MKTALVKDDNIHDQKNIDINTFVGYPIKATATHSLVFHDVLDLTKDQEMYHIKFYIENIQTEHPDDFEELTIQLHMEAAK